MDDSAEPRRSWRDGVRDGAPFGAATFVLAASFGVVATDAGMPTLAVVVMSVLVYSGSGQFAALGIVGAGGGVGAAVGAATLVSSRFLPMGLALGPSLRGGRLRRAVEGQATVDASWAMAARGDGGYDREYLFGHSAIQYVLWVLGTGVGVAVPELDVRALGLDAVFPAFFLALLVAEVRDRLRLAVALAGAALALALVPVAPPGLPVLVAAAAALAGLRAPR
ncbi:AzlC family ABC transporter permease [Geodermatophilus sp. CPCC 206100]|uniref:AzlC family ABC transporter permease n=1 Tax=Geodermatophilus sp. CPCC 206100 TaxID=3020054 RepID=UPI003B00B828